MKTLLFQRLYQILRCLKKVSSLTKQHLAALESERAIQNDLRQEVEMYEKKSMESAQALEAATRLTENIDKKEEIIQNLKQERKLSTLFIICKIQLYVYNIQTHTLIKMSLKRLVKRIRMITLINRWISLINVYLMVAR